MAVLEAYMQPNTVLLDRACARIHTVHVAICDIVDATVPAPRFRDTYILLYAFLQSTCFFLGPDKSWLDALHTIFLVVEPITSFLKAVALSATLPDIM